MFILRKIHLSLPSQSIPPLDRSLMPFGLFILGRSFSELYQKSLQEKRRSEPPAGEAELTRPGSEAGFKPATVQVLHSLSLQDGPPHSLAEERTEFLRSHSDGAPLPSNL